METRSLPRVAYDKKTLYMAKTNLGTAGFIIYDNTWQFFTPFTVKEERVDDSTTVPVVAEKTWVLPHNSRETYMKLFPEFLQSKYKDKIKKFLPFMIRVKKDFVLRL